MKLFEGGGLGNVSWTKLDNAAKVFPAVMRRDYSTFFRFEISLCDPVYADALERALADTLPRYPLFQTRLRRGLFWYFLEEYAHEPRITVIDEAEPCKYERLKSGRCPMWRVFAGDTRIALEVSHVVTDGIGALEFFRTLLCRYYELAYGELADWGDVKKCGEPAAAQELEMSYSVHHKKGRIRPTRAEQSFQYPDMRGKRYILTHMVMKTDQVKAAAHAHGASVTAFLAAVHLCAVQSIYSAAIQKSKKLVRELVLVNLRPYFDSKTLRNFYLFVVPSIDFSIGHYDLHEITRKIHAQLQDLIDVRKIREDLTHYVNLERNVFGRAVPWFIKNPVIRAVQFFSGETKMIGSISNLGRLTLPAAVLEKIRFAYFCPPPSRFMGRNISIVGCADNLTLTTGRYIHSDALEREMAKILLAQNIDVLYLDT